jgi:hypothetical protein
VHQYAFKNAELLQKNRCRRGAVRPTPATRRGPGRSVNVVNAQRSGGGVQDAVNAQRSVARGPGRVKERGDIDRRRASSLRGGPKSSRGVAGVARCLMARCDQITR